MGVVKRGGCERGNCKMLIINNVTLPLDTDFSDAKTLVLQNTGLKDVTSAYLYKKSVDARHKSNIVFCCSFVVEVKNEAASLKRCKKAQPFNKKEYVWQKCESDTRPIVVGFGPAGMFAALTLARAGLKPIVYERGRDVDSRKADVARFWNGGALECESNVQFGEGGAGTFSDGKLNTGIKDVRCRTVLETFCEFGADRKILYEAKPHIGTDVLIDIVKNIRNEILRLGGEIHFDSRVEDIEFDSKIKSVTVNGKKLPCSILLLAIGHSARDTYEMLYRHNISLERKSFAMGARIEHLQSDINKSLYGDFAFHPALGAADYKLVSHLKSGHAVYTFCMCPGGEVVNASSEQGGIAVNGMSYSSRDGKNANSALLVEVRPDDLEGDNVLAGIYLQRQIEQKAYGIKDGAVPYCYAGDLTGEPVKKHRVTPTVKPHTVHCDIKKVLPDFIADSIKNALFDFDKKIAGFGAPDAVLTFPETRSSSPVRIIRDENYCALNISGLYPSGEGAGYAGGITSAAVDGMRCAEKIIEALNK